MAPQEKAKELLEKYQSEKIITFQRSSSSPIEEYELSDSEAKFCIKILIDEIVSENKLFPYNTIFYERIEFWKEVKSEIEKL